MTPFFKRNLRRTLLGIFGATLVVGSLSACGHRGDHAWGANITPEQYAQKRDKMVDRAASKLDLNAEQKKLLASVGDKFFAQRQALMGQTTDPRAELKALIAGPTFDAAKAQALINEKTAAVLTQSPEVIAAMAAFFDSLNPTQQQKVRALMEGRHGWFDRG
jgi:periplasmic protein CpxP/Spy